MKYRIIHERDANGAGHYEAQYQVNGWFGLTWWSSLVEGADCSWPKRFDSLQAAETVVVAYIRSKQKARAVVHQGTVTGPAA